MLFARQAFFSVQAASRIERFGNRIISVMARPLCHGFQLGISLAVKRLSAARSPVRACPRFDSAGGRFRPSAGAVEK
jgi:hypothetical protein